MQELIQRLPTNRTSPRLWFERLVIFREPEQAHYIRTITFRSGLNLVWAKEPPPGSAKGSRAAGHGVGKTSLCLLLRFCLGDTAKAVAELREELFGEFPKGGIAAVLYLDDKPFTVCRYFNAYKEGMALAGSDIERLWQGEGACEGEQTYKVFEQQLAETMMAGVFPRVVPETGQAIEWRHVLAWMTRDQGSRFKSFFAWREGEGTGLQRSRLDPPIVMRAVLGLLGQGESDLLTTLSNLEQALDAAQQETARLQQEPALIRRRIESELRAWQGSADELPMHSDDLFKNSVEREIQAAEQKAAEKRAAWETKQEATDQALATLRAELKLLEQQYERAGNEYELADAARRQDEAAYLAIADKLLKLMNLTGWCENGNTPLDKCQHIQHEINRLHASDMRDGRDKKALERSMSEAASKAGSALFHKQALEDPLQKLRQRVGQQDRECKKIRLARDSAAIEAGRGKQLLAELARWQRVAGSAEAQTAIDQSQARCVQIKQEIDRVQVELTKLQIEKSTREKQLSDITDSVARELLSDDAYGSFDPRDESRPFRLSIRGGEAYRVLEVLLGDLTCLLDSGSGDSAFPGFAIHDCPREADMSGGLYENFLLLAERLQREGFGEHPPFQYIVTTTTPPPVFPVDGYLRLELDPSKDDGLLFKQRLR